MELREKVAQLPLFPGVYLYKDAGGRIIYVGKAKSLRLRVRSYFSEDKLSDVKTGTLIAEARTAALHAHESAMEEVKERLAAVEGREAVIAERHKHLRERREIFDDRRFGQQLVNVLARKLCQQIVRGRRGRIRRHIR